MTVDPVAAARVAPLLDALRADGLTPDLHDGEWLAVEEDGELTGVARLLERGAFPCLEDVWVRPDRRRNGIATALVEAAASRRRELWLICDEEDVRFYERRGFTAMPPDAFPAPLAALYARRGEWPGRAHVHVAMRRP